MIAYELLYTVIPKVFGVCRILEMVPLFLKQTQTPGPVGQPVASTPVHHGLTVSERENTQGLLVEDVDKDSLMFARIFPGDILLEIVGQPIVNRQVFDDNCAKQGVILLVQRAI